jgi:hypothetical protein
MSVPPVTWTFTVKQVETVWRDTHQVFGNKLWTESMLYDVFLPQWQEELERRSGRPFRDVLSDAVAGLGAGDPSLVFLGFRRAFDRYGIVTVFARHPLHGDVLKRAKRIESRGTQPDRPQMWRLPADTFHRLCAEITETGLDEELITESLAVVLSDWQLDELERRYGGELSELIYGVISEFSVKDGPAAVVASIQDAFAELGVTLRFAGVRPVLPDRLRRTGPPRA